MRMSDVMTALADGDAKVVDVTALAQPPNADDRRTEDQVTTERPVSLG